MIESDLLKQKLSLTKKLASRKLDLESIHGKLTTFLSASQSLQNSLSIPHIENQRNRESLLLLPSPLFTLYRHILGFSQSFPQYHLSLSIQGDLKATKTLLDSNPLDSLSKNFGSTHGQTSESTKEQVEMSKIPPIWPMQVLLSIPESGWLLHFSLH